MISERCLGRFSFVQAALQTDVADRFGQHLVPHDLTQPEPITTYLQIWLWCWPPIGTLSQEWKRETDP
jgi:hypothetical protein